MTGEKIALRELLEKGSDTSFLREIIGFAAERLMALETDSLCGAIPGERSAERTNQRNRYRNRDWQTRSVDDLVKSMGMGGIRKSQVSRLCGDIDERVGAFLGWPIEGDWPYIWLDAAHVKVRRDHHIVSVAAIVAVGVNTDGRCEVLGMTTGHSEAEPFWTKFFCSLALCGLHGVKLVVYVAHEGLKAAITKVLSATCQRCRVHLTRNVSGDRVNPSGSDTRNPSTSA